MDIDGVFAGGGMKAIAFIGALEVMEEKNYKFRRLAGTSAGAIFAALTKAGYSSQELKEELTSVDFERFLDPQDSVIPFKFMKWIKLYKNLGLYEGNEFEAWLTKMLNKKGISTFADIEKGSLKVVVSDLSRGRIVVLPDDLEHYGITPDKFSVARAVRMSSTIPYFFKPDKLQDGLGHKSVIVDGAVLSNFPIWLFSTHSKFTRPVIGFRLTPEVDNIPSNRIDNSIDMLTALIKTMQKAHDTRYLISNEAKKIVFIPVDHISSINFSLSQDEKEKLIQLGRVETTKFLKKWH
ncbi:MAG: patatin-like phospholipase family protein [Bacillaceae bacterium]|nr:patatin-like phospholipase family protein [Bacillaceae bacterium]